VPNEKISLEIGDSFLLGNEYGVHLHVVVAEASPNDSATILLVFISSENSHYRDPTTIIQPGEHPFITKKSWVKYQSVLIGSRNEIQGLIKKYYGKVTPDLLNRIQDGIEKTDRINDRTKNLLHQWKMDKLYNEIKDDTQ
jgi:hypothetical protein